MATYQHKQNGALVELVSDDGVTVKLHAQGGGFEYSGSSAAFHRNFSLAPIPVMRRGTVTAEWLDGVVLPCWSDGRRWNGSGMPYFERAAVDTLVGLGFALVWDGTTLHCNQGDEPAAYPAVVMPDGAPAWGVGAGDWLWHQVVFAAEPA